MILAWAAAAAAAMTATPCPATKTSAAAVCRAMDAEQRRDYAAAAQEFENAAGLEKPGDPAADRMLAAAGNMWIAASQPGKAALALDRGLAGGGLLADQRGLALLDRARAAEAQGDLKTARAKLNQAAETISADPFMWYFSAALAIRENDPNAAKSAISRALSMIPNDPTVLFEAGHVYAFAGDDKAARTYWERAAAADSKGPTGLAAKRALGMLQVPLAVTNQVSKQPNGDGEGVDR